MPKTPSASLPPALPLLYGAVISSCVATAIATWTPPEERHVPNLQAVKLLGRDYTTTGSNPNAVHDLGDAVVEEWSTVPLQSVDDGLGLTVRGLSRAYLARPSILAAGALRSWREVSFRKLRLLDESLSFTADLSQVGCGCNAAVYLVKMPEVSDSLVNSAYCDIQGFDDPTRSACAEFDLLEGNLKAVQATLHVRQGHGRDGTCNQDGCVCRGANSDPLHFATPC